jgi:hypothetical protein
MADSFLTLLDATRLADKTGVASGVVETVETYAPEVDVVRGELITGTSYSTLVRQDLPGSPTFRAANAGTETLSSTYSERTFGCYFADAQLEIDEAVLKKADQNANMGRAKLKAMEVQGVMRSKMIAFGRQFYNGTTYNADGFPGLRNFLDTTNMVVDATGSSTSYTAYFVWNDPMGIEFLFGNREGLVWNDWMLQRVTGADGKHHMAEVANLSGYIGLSCMHPKAVGVIKNITASKPLTDNLAAEMLAKFPIGIKPNLCFVERNSRLWLQKSRSVVTSSGIPQGNNRARVSGDGGEITAPQPTEILGVPIITTDSIVSETAW